MTRSSRRKRHMPQAGVEPARGWFLRPLPLPLGYCGRRRTRGHRLFQSSCSGQDSNLHQRDSRSRASAGWATGALLSVDAGGNRTLIRRVQTGCLPVRRRAHWLSVLREGVEPSTSAFGGPCSFRLSYRNGPDVPAKWSRQDSNLQRADSESAGSAEIGLRRPRGFRTSVMAHLF